jgi:hypothetical protein
VGGRPRTVSKRSCELRSSKLGTFKDFWTNEWETYISQYQKDIKSLFRGSVTNRQDLESALEKFEVIFTMERFSELLL